MGKNPLENDINTVLQGTADLWENLRNEHIFITGGTGFFGTWLLEIFVAANEKYKLNASAVVLTRNPDVFKKIAPDLAANPAIKLLAGDVKDFKFPDGKFSYIIHAAATSAIETFNNIDSLNKFDTVVLGTRRVLDFAAQCGVQKMLYTSSGVAYGKQPQDLLHIPETYPGAPDPSDLSSYTPAWGTAKRTAEFLCAYYAQKHEFKLSIARCFTFVGPLLPLDIHYAIGNFIRDALAGDPILIKGDGTPRRSYLYISDLLVWLWTLLLKNTPSQKYNVGSEKDVSIAELAHLVAEVMEENYGKKIEVTIAKSPTLGSIPDRYIPSTQKAQKELGLKETVELKEAINRTIEYYKNHKA